VSTTSLQGAGDTAKQKNRQGRNTPTTFSGRWDGVRRTAGRGRSYLSHPNASLHLLAVAGAGLLGFGVLMSVSTTISAGREADVGMWSQIVKEGLFVGVGLPIMYIAARMSVRTMRRLAYPALLFALFTLFAVLIPGIGVMNYDARRWIDLGPVPFQPSEFAKLAVLLWGADLLVRKQQRDTLRTARHVFVPLVPIFALVAALVMAEPDLGTTICLLMILVGLLWTVGLPLRYFTGIVVLLAGAVTFLAVTESYRLERLLTFTDPFKDKEGAGYHTVEGLYALASGGVYGVGLGNGTSKYSWVPNANTDYVFSVIGEELGLIGTIAVLLLFALFAFTGLRIARRSVDPFAKLAAGAATIWISGQAIVNVGYVTALLPVTGIPLPFISAGGTSLIATFTMFGMLFSFARHEPAAIAVAQRHSRCGDVGLLTRLLRMPQPKKYVAPKKAQRKAPARPAPAAAKPTRTRPATARPAVSRPAAASAAGRRQSQQHSNQRRVDPARADQRRTGQRRDNQRRGA